MRFLFSALAAPGHTFPLIPLAVALQRADHEVLFATTEGADQALAEAGITRIDAGMEISAGFAELRRRGTDARGLPPEEMMQAAVTVFGEVLPSAFTPDLVRIIEDYRPDAVVKEVGNVGAGFAADRCEVPVIGHGFGLISGGIGPRDLDRMRAIAARLGVTALRDPFDQPTIDLCPSSLRIADLPTPSTLLPMRPEPHRSPGAREDLSWRGDRPLIYLTLGTAFGSAPVLRQAVDGLSQLGTDLLVATGPSVDVADLGELPPRVRAEPWVQQADVVAEAALVVHHGGSGTTLAASAAGARQLLLPQGADQFVNADALVAAGSARRLTPGEATPAALLSAATDLLSGPGYGDAAARLAAEIAAMPDSAALAARLPELIS